jgi:PAS domain S-box-containing protein
MVTVVTKGGAEEYGEPVTVNPASNLSPSFAQAQVFALLDGTPLGAYVFSLEDPEDAASLRIVCANRASGDMLGLDPATVVGTLIGEYFPNSGPTTGIAEAYRDVVVSQTPREFGVVSYGDKEIDESRFALSAYPLGPHMVAILFDNLSATPARWREFGVIVENATDAIISKDLNGTILHWNPSAERMYGYSAAEAVGQSISMLLPADRLDEVSDIIARLRTGDRVDQFETKRVCKNGTIVDMSLTISPLTDRLGVVVGAATIARDISAQKEAALQSQRLAAIVATSEDAITSRSPQGIMLSWNPAAERLLGYSAEEIIGRSVDTLAPSMVSDEVLEIRAKMERGERARRPYEATIRCKDGSEVIVSISSSPIVDDDEELVGIASVMRDVSEHRRLEETLRQSQKMEAIGNLAGGVAHDFNNVLTVIRTAAESVLGELDSGAARDKVHQIDLAAEHAAALTGQLLAFSRRQVLQPERIGLNDIVTSTCDMGSRLIGEQIEVDLQLGDLSAEVEMDRGQLQQVILNLFVNARDAMPHGGLLRVRTSEVDLGETYVAGHFEVSPGEYILLEITDSGVGMDAATRARIFDPFFTTKAEGTGLGLATVYGIVKQSGGQVFVYSEPDVGTTFKVYLPPARLASLQPASAAPRDNGTLEGTETILLVEDAELLRPMIVEILESSGYTVLCAANGDEALAIFAAHDGKIDLLLTDIVMPGISGRELAEQVLARDPTIRVLFTSGYPDDSSIQTLVERRDIAFIQKPYGGSDLLTKVRATFAGGSGS